ncbi:MAG: sugar ABC transporter permease [Oscillospiraceae bacterium]|nr:sugar ABC transporter permease [Oscillospiraceae bacterium]MBO7727277.1 sugar ABC transporter permease [Oscillospiraceae bacterium]MBP5169388.1 sugar ABC transporter permease [Oscillospiraceae bacterium]
MKKPSLIRNLLLSLLIPCTVFLVLEMIAFAKGVRLFANADSWKLFFRAVANVTLTTFALSINLDSGRFDFSLGAVSMLSATVAGTLAQQWSIGPWLTLIVAIAVAALLGLVHGGVYVLTRIPPIIVSLGMALFFEGCAFAYTGGKGVSLVTRTDIIGFSRIGNYILVTVIAVSLIVLLFDYTRFGADYRALLSGQKIAVETGIREVGNALGCYAVSGALMGVVGFISLANTGSQQMSLNFGSIGIMFTAFLPMFIGGWIGRYINKRVGIMLGAVSMALISLAYARFDTASSVQSIISALLLVLFLIYLNNEYAILSRFRKKQEIKE